MGILENKVLKTISIQANFLATVSRKKKQKKTIQTHLKHISHEHSHVMGMHLLV